MSFFTGTELSQYLLETFVWTALLIAFVLVLRRPVSRYFGPKMAYALWALPMLRLLMPPVELPAWLAPNSEPESLADETASVFSLEFVPASPVSGEPLAFIPPASASGLPLVEIGIAIWLFGAVIFLVSRFNGYHKMCRVMLEDASEVGREGKVRLIETPATSAPLAFGVRDKVIALPCGFMAQADREARDLALAHELAHHRGHDILVNFAVQPLFALHWFNPLGTMGWLALRRDQESACDARVMENCGQEEKAIYAEVIASFAAGPNVALAAPMACPILGDKSIIQRLRSLTMGDVSRSRRVAGRALIGAAIIALPLTASTSYAESIAPAAPKAPIAPKIVGSVAVPQPPAPPTAPVAPVPLAVQAANEVEVETTAEDGKVVVVKTIVEGDDGEEHKKVRKVKVIKNGQHLDEEELEEVIVQLREGLAQADEAVAEAREEHRIAIKMANEKNGQRTVIETNCDGGDATKTKSHKDGGQTVFVCHSEIMAQALSGLREARTSLAEDENFDDRIKARVLEAIDEQIRNWEKDAG